MGKLTILMGKSTISMAIFNSYVNLCNKLPEGMPGIIDRPIDAFWKFFRLVEASQPEGNISEFRC